MAKNLKKAFAMMLAIAMCFTMFTIPAFAASTDGPTTVTNEDGSTTTTTVTVSDPDEDGNVTTVTEIVHLAESVDDNGNPITVIESTTTTVVTDANGDVIRTETIITTTTYDEFGRPINTVESGEGSESREWTEEDSGDEPGQPDITVDLIPGETTSSTVTDTDVSGNPPEDEEDSDFDYTETTETDRTIEATTSEVTGPVVNETSANLKPITSEDRADGSKKEDQYYDNTHYHYDKHLAGKLVIEYDKMPEDADYALVGTAEYSHKYITVLNVYYQTDEEGNILYDENGEPLIERLSRVWNDVTVVYPEGHELAGQPVQTLDYLFTTGSRPTMFWLKNENGEYVTAYCCDAYTGTSDGYWYSVSNLEDSSYYDDESAARVRAVASHGYWGSQTGTGSLEKITQDMLAAIEAGTLEDSITILGSNGEYVTFKISEIIGGLTEGEAMDATQAAIWSYANRDKEGVDDIVYLGAIERTTRPTDEGAARRMALYNWLMSLDGEEASTVVVNEYNFVDNLQLTVGDKIDERVLYDAEGNVVVNDVYEASLSFTLQFTPSHENNDLLIHITYLDLDGNERTITKRLAGTGDEGDLVDRIYADENGYYTISGLVLSENEDFKFDMRIAGVQYLEQDVYFYAPVGGREMSQSLVGIAEGYKDVDVSMSVTMNFTVDEDNHVRADRYWSWETDPNFTYDEEDPEVTPDEEPEDEKKDETDDTEETVIEDEEVPTEEIETEEAPEETVEIPEEETPLVEIPDEVPPLAEVPKTGDASLVWFLLASVMGTLLAVYVTTAKVRKEN